MAKNEKTSKSVASKAAKILRNPKSSKAAKSVAGSALTQAPDRKSKKNGVLLGIHTELSVDELNLAAIKPDC